MKSSVSNKFIPFSLYILLDNLSTFARRTFYRLFAAIAKSTGNTCVYDFLIGKEISLERSGSANGYKNDHGKPFIPIPETGSRHSSFLTEHRESWKEEVESNSKSPILLLRILYTVNRDDNEKI